MNRGITYSACLRGASYRHCFISFPHHWRAFITPATVPTFIVESIERSIVVSWAGHTHDQDNDDEVFVCLNSKLLSANEFSEGQAVIVRQVACPSPCTSASMNVLSDSDWEELTLNIDVAQNAFLTQFRVIKKDQVFPLWLEGGLIVYLKVHDCFPSAAVSLLQQNTEVKVEPFHDSSSVIPLAIKPFPREKKYWINHNSEQNNQKYTLKIIYTLFVLLGYGYRTFKNFPKLDVISSLKVLNYSPHPYLKPQSMLLKLLTIHPSIIIASVKNFKRTKVESASHFIATVYKHNNSPDTNSHIVNSSNSEFSQVTGIVAVVMIWEKLKEFLEVDKVYDDMETMLNHKSCIISSALRRKLVINESSIIVIETLNSPIKSKTFLVDVGTRKACKQLIHSSISASFSELNKICPIVFNDKTQLNLIVEGNCETVLLSTRDGNPVIVEKENITQVFFHFDTIPARQPACEIDDVDENADFDTNFIEEIKVNQEILDELLATIKTDLHLEVTSFSLCPQFILLQGNKSSGKTTLVQRLVTMLRRSPYFVYCHVVSLKTFKGKKVETVQKLLKSAISEALNYKPSLLVLDDLDFLTNVNNLEEKGAAFEYVSHMTFMVKNLLGQILEAMKIASRSNAYEDYMTVLATCISRNDVHSLLASSKGNHLFSKSISICPLSEESKLTFVRHCLENMYNMFMKEQKPRWVKNATGNIFIFKTKEIIPKLDNLTLSDIRNLSIRIYLEAKHRWLNDCKFLEDIYMDYNEDCQFSYTDSDILKAYDGFISSSVRALNISNTVRKATKIGGLQEARQTLEEMIIWPSKYPHLFSQTTLRLRSGILLYGPPGCGKSLLAKSFENYPHLNYITVKGPELLSKYIGQSEKAVRDAFERASSAKPCVLFFDEFESIAPRRGHDNTGVTDRVVNQLLTQMDGVEGLSGVYVLAATSRPELIDPALLRPGRLDKGVFCPLPDERDREDILSLLCEDINLDDLIDIKEIAKRTSGYSGADLQSVLSTALIKAAQTFIGRSLYEAVAEDTDSENISFASEINEMTESVDLKNYNNDTLSFPKEVSDHSSLYVTLEHISEALAEVQPSVTERERLRYEALYKKFTSNKESNFMTVKPGKKETLA